MAKMSISRQAFYDECAIRVDSRIISNAALVAEDVAVAACETAFSAPLGLIGT